MCIAENKYVDKTQIANKTRLISLLYHVTELRIWAGLCNLFSG